MPWSSLIRPSSKRSAPDVPAGKLGAGGKPEPLPLVLPGSFQRLLELAKVGGLLKGTTPPTGPAGNLPAPWSNLAVGMTVLASDEIEGGWWECVVLAINGTDVQLRWRDYPDLEYFAKPVTNVGLMSPQRRALAGETPGRSPVQRHPA